MSSWRRRSPSCSASRRRCSCRAARWRSRRCCASGATGPAAGGSPCRTCRTSSTTRRTGRGGCTDWSGSSSPRAAHAGRGRPRGDPGPARRRPHRAAAAGRRLPAAVVGRPGRAVRGGPGARRTAAPRRGPPVGVPAVLRPPARRDRRPLRQRLRVLLQGPRRTGRCVRGRRRGRGRRAADVARPDGRHALRHDAVRPGCPARPARRAARGWGSTPTGRDRWRPRCRRAGCACTRRCPGRARSRSTPTAWPTRSTSGCSASWRPSAPSCAGRSARPTTRGRSSPS